MTTQVGNADLAAIKTKVEELAKGLPKPLRDSYDSIVTAGMKLMWSPGTHEKMAEYLQSIHGPEQVPQMVAHGILKAISIIIQEANIPPDLADPFYAASMLAAKYLMCDALEYVEQKQGIPVDRPLIDQTTQDLTSGLFRLYGIDEAKMQGAADYADQQRFKKHGEQPSPPDAQDKVLPFKRNEEQGTGLLNTA